MFIFRCLLAACSAAASRIPSRTPGRRGPLWLPLATSLGITSAWMLASPAPAAAGTPTLTIHRNADGEILIAARAASLRQAAEQLSVLTQSELRLSAGYARPDSRLLTITWRGRNVEQAWKALLGAATNHALQCHDQRCRVWLLSAGASTGQKSANPATTASPRPPAARRTAEPSAGMAAPAAAAMQPDPPGLFPSE